MVAVAIGAGAIALSGTESDPEATFADNPGWAQSRRMSWKACGC